MVKILKGSVEPWAELFHGNGDGYGYGNGDGYGDDSQVYWMRSLSSHSLPSGSVLAYWRSHSDGSPANGGTSTRAKVGLVEEIKGPLKICTQNALHATFNPPKWKGEKIWIVAMYPPFQFDGDKIAALKREIIAETDFKL